MIYRCNECSNDVEVPVEASGLQLSFCSFCGSSKFSIPKAEPPKLIAVTMPEGKLVYKTNKGDYGGGLGQILSGYYVPPTPLQGWICSGSTDGGRQ